MPKLGGLDALELIRQMDHRAAVVITSGYSAETRTQQLLDQGAAAFLRKPFRLAELAALLDRLRKQRTRPPPG